MKALKTKRCPRCDDILTPITAYPRSVHGPFKPKTYCKYCDNKRNHKYHTKHKIRVNDQKRRKYELTKIYFVRLGRGRFPPLGCWSINTRKPKGVAFATKEAKHSFLLLRRLQVRWGKPHPSFISPVGKTLPDDCPECFGIVRYDEYGDQVCERCGLIQNDFPANDGEIYLTSGEIAEATDTASDERIVCRDRYYSQCFNKKSY
jgi:hypothetical protein